MIPWIIVIVALVLIDQVTKLFVVRLMSPGDSVDLIEGIFRFTYVQNDGAAFGMLSEHRWVFIVISVIAIIAMLVYLWKFRPDSKFACMAVSMIISGGIGNMIDRIFRSGVTSNGEEFYYVVDFLDFCAFPDLWKWVFNFADSCVCVGGGMLVLWLIISIIKDEKKARAEKLSVSVVSGKAVETAAESDNVPLTDVSVQADTISENNENNENDQNQNDG